MPMYTNIGGGGQKQIASLYINKDGNNKALNNAYGNINGSKKEIFSATKYYWYKQHQVSSYTLCDMPYWKNNTGASYESGYDNYLCPKNFYSTSDTIPLYSSMSYTNSSGSLQFSRYNSVSFNYNRTDHSDGSITYHLDPSYNGYYFPGYGYNDYIAFKISSYGSSLTVIYQSSYTEYRPVLKISSVYYKVPKSYSTNFNTVKYTSKLSLNTVTTGASKYSSSRTVVTDLTSGNSGYKIGWYSDDSDYSDDYPKSCHRAFYCDGYYYEYLGYYA